MKLKTSLIKNGQRSLPSVFSPVGAPGFEPGTSATRTQRSSRAEPRPELEFSSAGIIMHAGAFCKCGFSNIRYNVSGALHASPVVTVTNSWGVP
jgi:hypothetical protein